MAKDRRLFRRGATYWYRRRIPKDLLGHYNGKTEITYTLRTKDHADALARLSVENVKWDTEFAGKRNGSATAPTPSLSDEAIDQIVVAWFHDYDRELAEAELKVRLDPAFWAEWVRFEIDHFETDFSISETKIVSQVDALLADHQARLEPGTKEYARMRRRVREAKLEALRRHRGRLQKAVARRSDTLFLGDAGDRNSTLAPPRPSVTLHRLTDRYMTDPDRQGLADKTKDGYRVIFRALEELLGPNKPVREITRDDCRRVRDVLTHLPPNATKRFPGKTLEAAAAIGRQNGLPPLKPQAANSYLNNLSALFRWAVREEYVDRNPAEGLRVGGDKSGQKGKGGGMQPFNADQLRAIFTAPIFVGCVDDRHNYARPGPNRPRRWRFWLPIIGLMTGMRLNEICQLHVDDVHKVGDVDVIAIREDESGQKRVKTEAGVRIVPVHPWLASVGFSEYVAMLRRGGHRRLFPDLWHERNTHPSDRAQKWFSRFLRSVGAKTNRHGFHSFRYTMNRALREAGVAPDRIRELLGWRGGGMEENTYWSPLQARTLFEEICKAEFTVDLAHLHPEREGVDPPAAS